MAPTKEFQIDNNNFKSLIEDHIKSIERYNRTETYWVQKVFNIGMAREIMDEVEEHLGTLGPEFLDPFELVGASECYLATVVAGVYLKPKMAKLFDKQNLDCLFLSEAYKEYIGNIVFSISRLMPTQVRCHMNHKKIHMHHNRDRDCCFAKFTSFYLRAGDRNDENDAAEIRKDLVELFQKINGLAQINNGPEMEFELFYDFLNHWNFCNPFSNNVIFWNKAQRQNFICALFHSFEFDGGNFRIYYEESAKAFGVNWREMMRSDPDLRVLYDTNERIYQEKGNKQGWKYDSFNPRGSVINSGLDRESRRYREVDMLQCLARMRDLYVHAFKLEEKLLPAHSLTKLNVDKIDSLVEVFNRVFPGHIALLVKGFNAHSWPALMESFRTP